MKKTTTIINTHNRAVAPMADRVIKFKNNFFRSVFVNITSQQP